MQNRFHYGRFSQFSLFYLFSQTCGDCFHKTLYYLWFFLHILQWHQPCYNTSSAWVWQSTLLFSTISASSKTFFSVLSELLEYVFRFYQSKSRSGSPNVPRLTRMLALRTTISVSAFFKRTDLLNSLFGIIRMAFIFSIFLLALFSTALRSSISMLLVLLVSGPYNKIGFIKISISQRFVCSVSVSLTNAV